MQPQKDKLLFVATEDWFFCSHFLPMLRAAVTMGLDVRVVARVSQHRQPIEAAGARVIAWDDDRAARGLLAGIRSVRKLVSIFQAERPDIVHLIALKPVVLGGLAAWLSGVRNRIYAVTGFGILGADRTIKGKMARFALRHLFKWILDSDKAHYLFENADDPTALGLDAADASKVTIVGGAGVDPMAFAPTSMPPTPPLRVAIVGRMLWQKGTDIAVEATKRARGQGAAVELSLFGLPDAANPKSIPLEQLTYWNTLPGIKWHGRTNDVPQVWTEHHVCCMPSRGGEGLPRTILEAAACGRPIVTTDVPGCRSFVRPGMDGLVVRSDDPGHLAEAFVALAADPARVAAMGRSARERVAQQYTENAVSGTVAALYRTLLSSGRQTSSPNTNMNRPPHSQR